MSDAAVHDICNTVLIIVVLFILIFCVDWKIR